MSIDYSSDKIGSTLFLLLIKFLVVSCISVSALVFLIGCKGNSGNDGQSIVGPAGSAGLNGDDGQDATPTTVVKLCSQTPSYPSVFVEDALCIQGQLYAVYSIPNAFLTLLTPGNYTSNGIGSSCNFKVLPSCQIQH